jgi:aerobic C4-dicarboxylate transport protein
MGGPHQGERRHRGLKSAPALPLGIDTSISECHTPTALVGNGVATVVISRSEGELDAAKLHATMAHPIAVGEEMETLPA